MNTVNIIRALKDADYRNSLSEAERAALPVHPAGLVELPEDELSTVAGGGRSIFIGTCGQVCKVLTPKYGCNIVSH